MLAHLSAAELADLAGVDPATARRWRSLGRLPEPVRRLLEITALGRLDILGWRGWKVVRGTLVSPEGWEFTPGAVLAISLMRQQISHYQTLERRWKRLDAQPEPGGADESLAQLRERGAGVAAKRS